MARSVRQWTPVRHITLSWRPTSVRIRRWCLLIIFAIASTDVSKNEPDKVFGKCCISMQTSKGPPTARFPQDGLANALRKGDSAFILAIALRRWSACQRVGGSTHDHGRYIKFYSQLPSSPRLSWLIHNAVLAKTCSRLSVGQNLGSLGALRSQRSAFNLSACPMIRIYRIPHAMGGNLAIHRRFKGRSTCHGIRS